MYRLLVFYPDERYPRQSATIQNAADVLSRMQDLLPAHRGCHCVEVWMDNRKLFTVDGEGDALGDPLV
jgi:hypothetical protein